MRKSSRPKGQALEEQHPDVGHKWLTWNNQGGRDSLLVSSQKLEGRTALPNQTFPKIRSWVALGYPIELLSPLSVSRVLVALGIVIIGSLIPFAQRRDGQWIWMAGAALVILVTLVWLARSRSLNQRSVNVVILCTILAGAGSERGLGSGIPFLIPLAWTVLSVVTMDLYESPARVVLASVLVFLTTTSSTIGLRTATLGLEVGTAAGLLTLALGLIIVLVTQGARRKGALDPETGLPNGSGLAIYIDSLPKNIGYIAVGLTTPGISDVRGALGHEVGTDLLRRVVEDLGQVLPMGTRLGRVSGDDLVAIEQLPTASDDHAVEQFVVLLSNCLVEAVAAGRYSADALELQLRAHSGCAVDRSRELPPQEVIRRALLSAHKAERRQLPRADWSGESVAMSADDLVLLDGLAKAIHQGEIQLVYQPQYEAKTGKISGVEALTRWQSPTHGIVSPAVFIPLAERTGLIEDLTDTVLNEALDAQVRWIDLGMDLPVSVNLSARSLSNPNLPSLILNSLQRRGLSPRCLCLEVTETAETADLSFAIAALTPLHDAGIRISIDDFGAGYTSLSLLPDLPIDELKIDQKFVLQMLVSDADRAIVQAITALGHSLNLSVVAEGVESEEIARAVTGYNCDYLQGYHLAKPMPERALVSHHRIRFGPERTDPIPVHAKLRSSP